MRIELAGERIAARPRRRRPAPARTPPGCGRRSSRQPHPPDVLAGRGPARRLGHRRRHRPGRARRRRAALRVISSGPMLTRPGGYCSTRRGRWLRPRLRRRRLHHRRDRSAWHPPGAGVVKLAADAGGLDHPCSPPRSPPRSPPQGRRPRPLRAQGPPRRRRQRRPARPHARRAAAARRHRRVARPRRHLHARRVRRQRRRSRQPARAARRRQRHRPLRHRPRQPARRRPVRRRDRSPPAGRPRRRRSHRRDDHRARALLGASRSARLHPVPRHRSLVLGGDPRTNAARSSRAARGLAPRPPHTLTLRRSDV